MVSAIWQFLNQNAYNSFHHLHIWKMSENFIFQTPNIHASKTEKLIYEW